MIPARSPAPFDAARRSAESEILDDTALDAATLAPILRDLARFNGAMFGHWPGLAWLRRATRGVASGKRLTLLDVGCGYGDFLRAVRRFARAHELDIRLVGVDLSPEVIAVAKAATDPAEAIEYHVGDVFEWQAGEPADFIVSSLVTHHMSDPMIEQFLRWMEATARRGWFVYDLERSILPYYFIALSGWLMRVHSVVITDGRTSVARSLTRAEWLARFAAAGLPDGAVELRWFMFRFGIGRLR
jgi:2-polyprenyl-3-methyl-5-hydroxy-6-metoxy-1,4-benzoquinol methylase